MAAVHDWVDDIDAAGSRATLLDFALADCCRPPLAVVARGDSALCLAGQGTAATERRPDGAVPVPGGYNGIVIPVENFDACVSALTVAGVRLGNEPRLGLGGAPVRVENPAGIPISFFAPRA